MFPLPPPGSRPIGPMSHQPARPPPTTNPSSSNPHSDMPAASSSTVATTSGSKKKRKRPKKKRNRRESFAAPPSVDSDFVDSMNEGHGQASSSTVPVINEAVDLERAQETPEQRPISRGGMGGTRGQLGAGGEFRMMQHTGRRLSNTSLESEALLDHRDQPPLRHRRESRLGQNIFSLGRQSVSTPMRPDYRSYNSGNSRRRLDSKNTVSDDSDSDAPDDNTPLIKRSTGGSNQLSSSYGFGSRLTERRGSNSTSSTRKFRLSPRDTSRSAAKSDYDVNNPPSVPGTPKMGPDMGYDDVMVPGGDFMSRSPDSRRDGESTRPKDTLIEIDDDGTARPSEARSSPPSPQIRPTDLGRRRTIAVPAEDDVCFPVEIMSEVADDEIPAAATDGYSTSRRRRRRIWPDLSVLNEWSREEKEERSEGIRAKAISEPMFVDGRLRPRKGLWHRTAEDAPYRFTYFNEEFENTIHAQTISELVQPGQGFRELFIPDPPELSDSSSDEEEDIMSTQGRYSSAGFRSPQTNIDRASTRQPSILDEASSINHTHSNSHEASGNATPAQQATGGNGHAAAPKERPKRYGPRPTFWLDVLSPTDTEMRVIAKAFGIHALTAEDIMMQEAREKVELFRNYYFINYRTFEQDENSEDYLEPVNMYAIVFREGVLTFHFSQSPHPANVRRRIRQLKDYLILSADWISYALIDDITDVFGPLIQSIEDEVDDVDETILKLHLGTEAGGGDGKSEANVNVNDPNSSSSGGAMLRQIGECRKKVMGLYRLLGNKADVIKGFAKRCNEQWSVAPKSEIGLYLGDIQDHILTMTSNLSHYETLLSRAHSNYLAQINIRMNERAEQTADVLGKLTVLGTIVLPMNIICGMWGMNVKVPGQDIDNLYWFWSITAGLMVFAFVCFFIAKRVYGIV